MRWRGLLVIAYLFALTACNTLIHRGRPDAGAPPAARRVAQAVQLETADHWALTGTLTPAPAADDDGTAVLLVHQLAGSRAEWSPLIQKLQAHPAVTVLAIDLRGHGESTRGPQGDDTTWETFGTDPERWAGLVQDVDAAVRYLRSSGGATRVVLVGSSIGGSAVLTWAANATDPSDAAGVVMLSPGLAYHGMDTRLPMQHYAASGRTALVLSGDQDTPSVAAVTVLGQIGGTAVQHEVYGGVRQHGVAACTAAPGCWDRVDTWIRTVLRPRPSPGASSPDAAASPPGQ